MIKRTINWRAGGHSSTNAETRDHEGYITQASGAVCEIQTAVTFDGSPCLKLEWNDAAQLINNLELKIPPLNQGETLTWRMRFRVDSEGSVDGEYTILAFKDAAGNAISTTDGGTLTQNFQFYFDFNSSSQLECHFYARNRSTGAGGANLVSGNQYLATGTWYEFSGGFIYDVGYGFTPNGAEVWMTDTATQSVSSWTDANFPGPYFGDASLPAIERICFGSVDQTGHDIIRTPYGPTPFTIYIDEVELSYHGASSDMTGLSPPPTTTALLLPRADIVRGGWTAGAGGTVNLFAAVDNVPPAGSTSATDTTQIVNAAGTATDDVDFELQSLEDIGVPAGAVISSMQPFLVHGVESGVGAVAGAIKLVSPAASEDTFTFGYGGNTHGVWPTNWGTTYGSPAFGVDATSATRPVVRISRRTANSTNIAVAQVGVIVRYGLLTNITAARSREKTATLWDQNSHGGPCGSRSVPVVR